MSPDLAPFFERRQRFTAAIGDALAVIPGGVESLRNGDVHYEFRQASDFFFLTGFDEPDAVAVINPAHAKERFVLFVRPRDREMEIWNGRRAGTEGAIATYGADAAYTIDQLDAKLREYAVERPVLYYRLGHHAFDARITRLLAQRLPVDRGLGPQRVHPALRREYPAHGRRRPPADRRRLRVRLHGRRHHAHLSGQRTLQRAAARGLRDRPARSVGGDRRCE